MTSYYVSDRQARELNEAVAIFRGIGTVLAAEEDASVRAGVYAQIVRKLLAVVGKPTVEVERIGGRPDRYVIRHPDERVRDAIGSCSYYRDQLLDLGLIEVEKEPEAKP